MKVRVCVGDKGELETRVRGWRKTKVGVRVGVEIRMRG